MVVFNITLLIFSVVYAAFVVVELRDQSTPDRAFNGFFLAVAISNIFTSVGKLV